MESMYLCKRKLLWTKICSFYSAQYRLTDRSKSYLIIEGIVNYNTLHYSWLVYFKLWKSCFYLSVVFGFGWSNQCEQHTVRDRAVIAQVHITKGDNSWFFCLLTIQNKHKHTFTILSKSEKSLCEKIKQITIRC